MTFMTKKDIRMALNTVRASRSRSLLTVLGVVISVAAIISIVSIGNGIKSAIVKQANQYSKNVITVRPALIGGNNGALSQLSGTSGLAALTKKDAAAIEKVPHVTSSVPLTVVGTSAFGDSRFNGVVYAVSSDLPTVINQEIAYGAFFTSKEDSNAIAVLGANAADKLFDQRVPLGRAFYIRGQQYIVGGVLSKFAATPFSSNTNFNDAIFVPSSSIPSLAPNGASIYQILAKVDDGDHVDAADAAITKALTKTHGNATDVGVYTPTQLADQSTQTFGLLTSLTLAAALVTLLVSGIGIMNVMLVSVTERIHEIGIRKAVGATNRQIRDQFVTEAATLCAIGSILGVVVSFVACFLLGAFSNLQPVFDWKVALLACVAACVFGMIFGTLPAIKAARKDPIAALRNE